MVLLSPHSDDIALSLGASLLGWSAVSRLQIATVFSISNCTADDSVMNSPVVSIVRKAEDIAFIAFLGQETNIVWWDREDAPLRRNIPDESVFHSEPSPIDLDESLYIMDRIRMEYRYIDILFAPMAIGRHIDHIVVRNAALELLAEGFPVAFYEDLPYAADSSLVEIDEYAACLANLAGQELSLCPIETGIFIEEKVALISCYRSQMESRTESRVRSHAGRCSSNSVVERVWASKKALCTIHKLHKGGRS